MLVLQLAADLTLQKLALRPRSYLFDLDDESVDVKAAKAKLAEAVEVLHDQPQIAVQVGDGGVECGLGEGLRLGAWRACNVGSSHVVASLGRRVVRGVSVFKHRCVPLLVKGGIKYGG
jgi:hypothetical protein